MTGQPWHWDISFEAWFDKIGTQAALWDPSELFVGQSELFIEILRAATKAKANWIWHPCVSCLTTNADGDLRQRNLQLAVWIALHANNTVLDGECILVPTEMSIWTNRGAMVVPPGNYTLCEFSTMSERLAPHAEVPVLDVWGDSIGCAEPQSWAALPPTTIAEEERLALEVGRYLRVVRFLEVTIPDCYAWIANVTKVSVPLRGEGDNFQSGSHPGVPGMVLLDLRAECHILEALVHESAHHYLYLAEAWGPLVDPSHGQLYHSPLRPEPRPLRSILLAYHALAYISAFYRETLGNSLVAKWGTRELPDRREQALTAEDVLVSQSQHLTAHGRNFVEMTRQVLEYSVD